MADEIPVSARIAAVVELFNGYTKIRDERALTRAMAEITTIADSAADEGDRATANWVLGFVAWEVYQLTRDRAALDASVIGSRTVLAAIPADHPRRPSALSNLAGALRARFDDFGDAGAIKAAVGHMREAVALTPAGTEHRALMLGNLSGILLALYEAEPDGAVVDEAVASSGSALDLVDSEDSEFPVYLSKYAKSVLVRFQHVGDPADLAEAVERATCAVALVSVGHPHAALLAYRLRTALALARTRVRHLAEFDAVIEGLRLAISRLSPYDQQYRSFLADIAEAQDLRFSQAPGTDALAVLAVDLTRLAEALPPGPERLGLLCYAGNVCIAWTERSGDPASLDAAVDLYRRAEGEAAPETPRPDLHSKLSIALAYRYQARRAPADLEAAIDAAERALAVSWPEHPEHIDFASRLGLALRDRHERYGDPADLARAIGHARDAVAWSDPNDQAFAGRLSNLAMHLSLRFSADRRSVDLDEAIALSERAVAVVPDNHPRQAMYAAALASGLFERYRESEELADLEASITTAEWACGLPGLPVDHVMAVFHCGRGLVRRFRVNRTPADLDAGIAALREAISRVTEGSVQHLRATGELVGALALRDAETSTDDGEKIDLWVNVLIDAFDGGEGWADGWADELEKQADSDPDVWAAWANVLQNRWENDRRPGLVRTAVIFRRRDLATLRQADPAWPGRASALAGVLRMWFEVNGNPADLDEAIGLSRAALAHEGGQEDRALILNELGVALMTRYERCDTAMDLDDALEVFDRAMAEAPEEEPLRQRIALERANVYLCRYKRSRDLADAEIASAGLERLAEMPERLNDRLVAMFNLANLRFAKAQDAAATPEDRTAADTASRALLAATPKGHPIRQRALMIRSGVLAVGLATGAHPAELRELNREIAVLGGDCDAGGMTELYSFLHQSFRRTGDRSTLEAMIEAGRRALEALPADHPARPALLTEHAVALHQRLVLVGDLADAETAIALIQQAIAAEPDVAKHRVALGMVLLARYSRTSGRADLDASVAAYRLALVTNGAEPGVRLAAASNLASALQRRFQLTRDRADLDEAVALASEAAAEAGAVEVLNNLGIALANRYVLAGAAEDAAAAIDALERALSRASAGDPGRLGTMSNLANIHSRRHAATGDPDDLDAAVRYSGASVAAAAPDHADRAAYLVDHGVVLLERDGPGDRNAALRAFRVAAASETAAVATRVQAARAWGDHAASEQDWAEAVSGYTAAIELLPRLAPRSLSRADQEKHLAHLAGLASSAAAAALRNDDPEGAVRLLEQGRGVLYAQALDTRGDLSAVAARYPELAAELAELRERLDPVFTHVSWEDSGRRRRDADRWDELVAKARELPGLRSFLLPPALWELTDEAAAGPLVYVNVSEHGSDALAVTADGITVVPLPDATPEKIRMRSALYFAAVFGGAFDHATLSTANTEIARMLAFLWDAIVGPILAALDLDRPGDDGPRRVWWLPVGQLSLLPLHAAGHHRDPGRSTLDLVVSSYIPTIRALQHGRRRPAATAGSALAVVMPHTPDVPNLPYAEPEAAVVRTAIPDTLVLSGAEATRDRVLAELAGRSWAHFACHGAPDMAVPSAGRLVVHDHREDPLTVLDLANLRMDGAQLAFLSACMTAATPPPLGDEAIHLAAACQLAGYAHVIATTWPVVDKVALNFSELCYSELTREGHPVAADDTAIALAVHNSVRKLRERYPNFPSLWAPYIHTGI